MTYHQERMQCDGPRRPTPDLLAVLLSTIPAHNEIRAVSINGQTGQIIIEYTHEGLPMEKWAPPLSDASGTACTPA